VAVYRTGYDIDDGSSILEFIGIDPFRLLSD
jgi:hypothetical protein